MNLTDHIVENNATISEVVDRLEQLELKLCLTLDQTGRIENCFSQRDVETWARFGTQKTDLVNETISTTPTTITVSNSEQSIRDAFIKSGEEWIVLVDEDQMPVAILHSADFFDPVFLSPPHMGGNERKYVDQAFEENYIAPAGSNLVQFERDLKLATARAHAVALSSGTAGLHLAMRALGVGIGDRVYVSDSTFIASVNPILYEGATPVFIDCDPFSWNLSPAALQRALTLDAERGSLPKAIVVVHLYGQSAEMTKIMALAGQFDVPVIEDATESLGARYKGRPSGSHGLVSVYSFNGNKIITTSGGGALVTDDEAIATRVRKMATQSREPAEHYEHSELGFNYRMSNVLAGIGRGQLEVLPERVESRRQIFENYSRRLNNLGGISFQGEWPDSKGNRWLSVLRLESAQHLPTPLELLRVLRRHGIEARPGWKPMHMQPLFKGFEFWPHSPEHVVGPGLFETTLCLPSGSSLCADEQNRICKILENEVHLRAKR